ncbi:MAG: hypothetical protein ACSNEK_07975 [Parachlamydiaceae bacterium]
MTKIDTIITCSDKWMDERDHYKSIEYCHYEIRDRPDDIEFTEMLPHVLSLMNKKRKEHWCTVRPSFVIAYLMAKGL